MNNINGNNNKNNMNHGIFVRINHILVDYKIWF